MDLFQPKKHKKLKIQKDTIKYNLKIQCGETLSIALCRE